MKTETWLHNIDKGNVDFEWSLLEYQRDGFRIQLTILSDAVKLMGIREAASPETMQLVADRLGAYLPTAYIHEQKWKYADYNLDPLVGVSTQGSTVWSQTIDRQLKEFGYAAGLVSGYCKAWVIDKLCTGATGNPKSAPAPRGVNHGFVVPKTSVKYRTGGAFYRGINVDPCVALPDAMCIQCLGTRHGITHSDYSQPIVDLVKDVTVDGTVVAVHDFYTMYTQATHNGLLAYSRQPGVDLPPGMSQPNGTADLLWKDPQYTIAERSCAWLGNQFGLGVREIPGASSDPIILGYSQNCRRGGTFLGRNDSGILIWEGGTGLALKSDEDPWCAAAASKSLEVSLLPGDRDDDNYVLPHGLRVSVRELCEDARVAGSLRDLSYTPKPGDLAIYSRNGQNPLQGGQGHVRVVLQILPDAKYLGIGGNENDTFGVDIRPVNDAHLRAWIER